MHKYNLINLYNVTHICMYMYTYVYTHMFPGPVVWHWINNRCALSWSLFLTLSVFYSSFYRDEHSWPSARSYLARLL